MLVLFFLASTFAGCPKHAEPSPDRAEALDAAAAPLSSTRAGADDAGRGERAGGSREALGAGTPDAGGARPQAASPEACVDRWLSERGLDRYGHPQGTMYAGGTPLFDERTGERTDRLEYVQKRHPQAREACARPDAGR